MLCSDPIPIGGTVFRSHRLDESSGAFTLTHTPNGSKCPKNHKTEMCMKEGALRRSGDAEMREDTHSITSLTLKVQGVI